MKSSLLACLLTTIAVSAHAAVVTVLNPDFDAGSDPDADAWVRMDGSGANSSPSCYAEVVGGYGTGRNMHLKADGGNYVQQALTISDTGPMDATTFSDFTVNFDYGQRQNTSDGNIRVSLWNTTTDTEIVGVNQTITGATETWTAGSWNLTYDNSVQTAGDGIALRITSMDTDLGNDSWKNTASMDNVAVTAEAEPLVPTPPSINGEPQSASIDEGRAHTFTVSVSGSQPMIYQWKKNGVELSSETAVSLMFSNLSLTDAGDYSVVATNAYGSVTSAVATLTVLTDDIDNDGLPNDWEIANGLDPYDDGAVNPDNGAWGDPDGDGLPNDEEFFMNSNPQVNESGQAWRARPEKARLMAINAHPDDEGIFFGGVIPYYTQVRQLPMVCVSVTSGDWGRAPEVREAEFRDAVWAYGLRNQPIFPRFKDYPTDSVDETWDVWADGVLDGHGVTEGRALVGETLAYWIRRYRPDVVVTHDFGGEYGHPNHKATALATTDALTLAADSLVDLGGLPAWQVKKLYIHNYENNPLFHDDWQDVSIDTNDNGTPDQTPIQVANTGLDFHVSQGKPNVSTCYANNETNSGWEPYPCEWWGLYSTEVGNDSVAPDWAGPDADNNSITYSGWARSDFFENLTAFADSDYDELADAWELDHFASLAAADPHNDDDGDGYTLLDEFSAGLDPAVADSLGLAIAAAGQTVSFAVSAASGAGYEGLDRRYQLKYSPDLVDWSTVVAEGVCDGSQVVYAIPTGTQVGFYRLSITLE